MGKANFFQLKMYFHASDVELLLAHAQASNTGLVCLDIQERRKPSEKGTTHYGTINTWKPKEVKQDDAPAEKPPVIDDQNLPF